MSLTIHGKHFIAGEYIATKKTFANNPAYGEIHYFSVGNTALVNRACEAAEEAFWHYGYSDREARAAFLNAIADEIDIRAEVITIIASQETGLSESRLQGERGRTVGQLRLFASHILAGNYLDRCYDKALADRKPQQRPDIRLMQRPVGPVAVFGASNFPLAFSTAGGDTASALAAGCPVVVKGHESHPGTSEIVAEAIRAAIVKCGIHPGVFSLIHGGEFTVGQSLVQHPLIKAVGFTGSLTAGKALFNLCATRPEPIPFYGELGSINPVFLLPKALVSCAEDLAAGWAESLTMGAGQFCTNPGVLVLLESGEVSTFIDAVVSALSMVQPQVMVSEKVASAYCMRKAQLAAIEGVQEVLNPFCDKRNVTPSLFVTTAKVWFATPGIREEVFGPLGLIVIVKNQEELLQVAHSLDGQITCTILMNSSDTEVAQLLIPIFEGKAGRILINDFPTGVEVCDAMVHGGPYPASTNFGETSVGTMAIRRFLRLLCYQNFPVELLPADLRQDVSQ